MAMQRFLAAQLRRPQGWFGSWFMSGLLNRINRRLIDSTLTLLDVKPEYDILEIGFGGGSAISHLAGQAGSGVITGVDISPEMIRRAERRFRGEIRGGRLRVHLGDVTHLKFAEAAFDRVFTVNTLYFWPDVPLGFSEIHRVLRSGGLAAITIRSKEVMERSSLTQHGFRLFSAEEVVGLMTDAGFRDIRAERRGQGEPHDHLIILGTR